MFSLKSIFDNIKKPTSSQNKDIGESEDVGINDSTNAQVVEIKSETPNSNS